MATTTLPRLSVSRAGRGNGAPGPAYLPSASQRDPIVGTIRPFQRQLSRILPDIYQRNFNKNTRYEPKIIMIMDKTGKKIKLPVMDDKSRSPSRLCDTEQGEGNEPIRVSKSTVHSSIHERSVFENTGYGSSYFIIHPDWTSEAAGRRKLTTRERPHQSWDGRPAVHPLSAYIDPLLEKRRLRDQYIKALDQAKHNEQSRCSSSSQFAKLRSLKPTTPKDSQGHYKGFSMY